jgi:uncharacterized membrane protein YcaP (DUF421 family)
MDPQSFLNSVWSIPLRTLIIYLVVLIGLRLTGKRPLGQMAPFDLVLLLLISNAVQNAMTGPDNTVLGGILSASTLLIANLIFGHLSERVHVVRTLFLGEPTELIRDGELLTKNLEREDITDDEVLSALREHGVEDVEKVQLAMLEIDGTISVVSSDAKRLRGRRRSVRFIKANR